MQDFSLNETEYISLCEALDRILNKGAVLAGEVTISIANIDLLYLGLQVMVSSIETARKIASNHDHPLPVRAGSGTEILTDEFYPGS